MTAEELIKELQDYPPDAEVLFKYSYTPPCNCPEYCYCSEIERCEQVRDVTYYDKYSPAVGYNQIVLTY